MKKVAMTVDPHLIQLLGRKLYSSHTAPIVVRELLQNSLDACTRKEVDPKIHITLKFNSSQNKLRITCEDNGCGMDENELIDVFLCLGGSTKKGTNSTGKFGIAKASIMSGEYWSVTTLDNEIDIDDLIQGNDLRKVPYLDGTKIVVECNAKGSWEFKSTVTNVIYSSSVKIHYTYIEDDVIMTDDENAGFEIRNSTLHHQGDGWRLIITEPVKPSLGGCCFVRLNQLTQFRDWQSTIPSNLTYIIDVDNVADPTSPEYPFTMSRESLAGNVSVQVNAELYKMREESESIENATKAIFHPPNVRIHEGWLYTGKGRNIGLFSGSNSLPGQPNKETHEGPYIKFENYENRSKQLIAKDEIVLSIFRDILEFTVPKFMNFGIGIIIDPERQAAFETFGFPVFSINPDFVHAKTTQIEKITSIWVSACHEVAHLTEFNHNQAFVAEMGELQRETLPRLIEELESLCEYF